MKPSTPTRFAVAVAVTCACLAPAGGAQAADDPEIPQTSFSAPAIPDGYAHPADDQFARDAGAISEAFCTEDDFEPAIQTQLLEDFQNLPVVFGSYDAPKDPQADARRAVTGTDRLTDEARHQLCTDAGAQQYRDKLAGFIAEYGVLPNTEAGVSGPEDTDQIDAVWRTRIEAFRTTLVLWLPPDA